MDLCIGQLIPNELDCGQGKNEIPNSASANNQDASSQEKFEYAKLFLGSLDRR
jgi:hypothetical protein